VLICCHHERVVDLLEPRTLDADTRYVLRERAKPILDPRVRAWGQVVRAAAPRGTGSDVRTFGKRKEFDRWGL
jgi:hypothetical protein